MIPVEEVYNESKTFLKVPHLKIFNVFKLNPAERIVFSVILSRCSTSKFESCHRSIPELVQDTHGFCGYVTVSKAITRLRELNLISSDNLYGNNRTATYYVNTDKVIQIQKMSDDELNTVIVPEKKSKGQKRNPATEKQSPEVINQKIIATENSNVSELNDNDLPPYNQEDFDINSYFGEPCSNSPYENAPVDTSQISDIPHNSLYVQDITTQNTFTPETVTSIPPAVSNVPAVQPPVQEKPKQKRFVKPTLEEVTSYMAEKIKKKYGDVQESFIIDQAESFYDHYQSNGWKVGKNPMKDWQSTVSKWVRNIQTFSTAGTGTSGALIVATAEQSTRPDFDTIYKEVIDIAGKLQNRSNWLSESANKNIMAGVRTFIAEEIKAHWNLYGESDWKNALNVFIFAQKSPLRYLDPNFCKNNGFDSGLYNEFWTGSTFFIPRNSDEPTVTEQVIESEHFQKSLQEDLERKRRVSEFKKKLNAHREEMANAYK